MLKIKQKYCGTGKKEGYIFQLFNGDTELCHIENVPVEVYHGATLDVGGEVYYVDKIYDCEESPEQLEVVWYILKPFKVDFKLKLI